MKNISVIGTGYVGLVAGTCFAELGNNVICADVDLKKIESLNNGICPIYEPGLDELIGKNVKAKRLSFTTDLDKAVNDSDLIFIAVGTPPKESGEADLSYVERVARQISSFAKKPKIVVEKSTVPVETCEKIETVLNRNSNGISFEVVSNPEFLREGTAVEDFMKPDRVVVGCRSEHAKKEMEELYAPLKAPIIFTDVKSAEIIKHASNSFLATKISFINGVANLCEQVGADVEKVAEGMGYDKRIGRSFLYAGIGYGGSCFPKDVSAFVSICDKHGYDFALLKEVQKINKLQRINFIKKIESSLWVVKGKTIAVLGLSFKPNTDDMRDAPSIDIINALQSEGAVIKAFDPVAMEKAKPFLPKIQYCRDEFEACAKADALVILTEWPRFKKIDLKKLKQAMNSNIVLDGRNIFDQAEMKKLGFNYISIGR